MIIADTASAWIAALMSVFVFSFVYKENRLFRAAEHLVVGAASGHWCILALNSIYGTGLYPFMKGGVYIMIVPLVLGILLFTTLKTNYVWISRYGMAVMLGVGLGIAVRSIALTSLVGQVIASVRSPLWGANALTTFNSILMLLLTVTIVSYFIFTRGHVGILGGSAKFARYGIMAALGVGYGGFALQAMTLLIARIMFLLSDPARYAAVLGIILCVLVVARGKH